MEGNAMLIDKLLSVHSVQPPKPHQIKPRFGEQSLVQPLNSYRVITITTVEPEKTLADSVKRVWNRLWSVPDNEPIVYRVPAYTALA